MAQHDYNIANQSGAAFRADLNNALSAIVSQNSGAAEPSTTYAYMPWADTTNGLFKIRNAANSAWITLYQLDGEWSAIPLENGSATAPPLYFKTSGTDTGIFSPGTDQFGIATAGVERVEYGTSEVVFNDGGVDYDLRVEGDTKANLFFVDASADAVSVDGVFSVTGNATVGSLNSTGNATVGSLNSGPLAGSRNRIINGDMRIAQRGTSFAAITGGTYSLDRWQWGQVGAMVCTVSQDTDAPNNTFQSSHKVAVTTVDTSIAAGDYAGVLQKIEGYNVRDLIGKTFTLSFWVKSPKTGTHCIAFRNLGVGSPASPDRSYIKEYTIVAANTWEYKTITVTGGLITAGTWSWTNGIGMHVIFTLATGTTFQTTADAWQTGNFLGTANQVNVMDNTANEFFLTGVQLEAGSVATPFERRSYGQELAFCQRYYEKLDGSVQAPGIGGASVSANWIFKVTKRATPTVTGNTGTAPSVGADVANTTNTSATASWASGSTASIEL